MNNNRKLKIIEGGFIKMNEEIMIKNLKDYPEFVTVVAKWIYDEFVKNRGERDFEYILKKFENTRLDALPLTFISVINNECVGVVSVFDNDLSTKPELTPWLAGLYVPKKQRGKGIAKLLINEVIEQCRKMNYTKVYLRTEHTYEYYKKLDWILLEKTFDEIKQETYVFYKII